MVDPLCCLSRLIRENKIMNKPKIGHLRNLSSSKKTNYTVFDSESIRN